MDFYLGEIRLFAGNYAPEGGWMLCQGQALKVSDYQPLFSLLGTTYGGDGVTTFMLPDLRGRIPVGQGQGAGLGNYVLGQKGGTETVTLTPAQLPAHNHTFNTLASAATTSTLSAGATTEMLAQATNTANTLKEYINNTAPTPTTTTLDAVSYGSSGGSQYHNNVMPSMALNYIIAVQNGLYPQAQ